MVLGSTGELALMELVELITVVDFVGDLLAFVDIDVLAFVAFDTELAFLGVPECAADEFWERIEFEDVL